ncbi:Uncharacterised protein [uncultured archaeon]|nr:Uncharacterised protein [uncultured archaeon]
MKVHGPPPQKFSFIPGGRAKNYSDKTLEALKDFKAWFALGYDPLYTKNKVEAITAFGSTYFKKFYIVLPDELALLNLNASGGVPFYQTMVDKEPIWTKYDPEPDNRRAIRHALGNMNLHSSNVAAEIVKKLGCSNVEILTLSEIVSDLRKRERSDAKNGKPAKNLPLDEFFMQMKWTMDSLLMADMQVLEKMLEIMRGKAITDQTENRRHLRILGLLKEVKRYFAEDYLDENAMVEINGLNIRRELRIYELEEEVRKDIRSGDPFEVSRWEYDNLRRMRQTMAIQTRMRQRYLYNRGTSRQKMIVQEFMDTDHMNVHPLKLKKMLQYWDGETQGLRTLYRLRWMVDYPIQEAVYIAMINEYLNVPFKLGPGREKAYDDFAMEVIQAPQSPKAAYRWLLSSGETVHVKQTENGLEITPPKPPIQTKPASDYGFFYLSSPVD